MVLDTIQRASFFLTAMGSDKRLAVVKRFVHQSAQGLLCVAHHLFFPTVSGVKAVNPHEIVISEEMTTRIGGLNTRFVGLRLRSINVVSYRFCLMLTLMASVIQPWLGLA